MKNLALVSAQAAMDSLAGRFVSVTFTKKDGTITKRNGKLAKSPPSHKNHGELFTLIQYQQKTESKVKYASVNAGKVLRLAGNGQVMEFKAS